MLEGVEVSRSSEAALHFIRYPEHRTPVAERAKVLPELGTRAADATASLGAGTMAEDRAPPSSLWAEPLVASRLLEYEIWTRINARRLGRSHGEEARALIQRVALIELTPPVLERALEPFPVPVRTFDALHLASITFLLGHGQTVELATYDNRLGAAAQALGIPIV